MQFDLTRFPAVAVSMAAVISLVSGPSPSAARADYQAHLVQEEDSRQRSVDAAHPAGDQSGPSDQRDPPDKRSSLCSFVAPAAAKPAETDTSVSKAAAQASAPDLPLGVISLSQQRPTRVASRQLHRPAFQANAPPSR